MSPESPDISTDMAAEFGQALKNRTVFLNYQPIISFITGKLAGFEALMRWTHPIKGPIPPSVFIPAAEQSGLIVDASKFALREACIAQKRIESRAGYENELFMSVNFSSHDFASPDFVDTIYNIVSESDVPIHLIHLEITEKLFLEQREKAKQTLATFTDAGLGLSLDDFDATHTTLGYLEEFPIDTLKIDRNATKDMLGNDAARQQVDAIIKLAHSNNLNVIAEGVETKEIAKALKDMGCDMAQGYYFSKPLGEAGVMEFARGREVYKWD